MLNKIFNFLCRLKSEPNLHPFIKYKKLNNAVEVMKSKLAQWVNSKGTLESHLRLLDVGGGDGSNVLEFLGELKDRFEIHVLDLELLPRQLNSAQYHNL